MDADQLAEKWINELLEAGFDYDGMLRVFALARKKLDLIHSNNEGN